MSPAEGNPVRAVIVVARKSWKVPDAEVSRLSTRNERLFVYFRQTIYPKLAGKSFGLRPDLEFTNIVLNRISSNTNIADNRTHGIALLKRKLDTYEAEGKIQNNTVVLILSGDDGFFTNINGIADFFGRYSNIPIRLIICTGEDTFDFYKMGKVLQAISDIKDLKANTSKEQNLVRQWIGVAVNKEIIAQANRDLKRVLPQRRNEFLINVDNEHEVVVDQQDNIDGGIDMTNEPPNKKRSIVASSSTRRILPVKYAISKNANGQLSCPVTDCAEPSSSNTELLSHVLDHCRDTGSCVLCPENASNPFTPISFLTRGGQPIRDYTKPLKEHMQRHLPPTFFCEEPGCSKSFYTNTDMLQHMESHTKSEQVACAQCGGKVVKTYMKKHLKSFCPERDADSEEIYECHCGAQFSRQDMFYKHTRAAHRRRDEIIDTAHHTEMFDAGTPGLGLDVTTAIERSLRMHLDQQHEDDKEQEPIGTTRKKIRGKNSGRGVGYV